MKKTKLNSNIMFDFELFGLICTDKEYKLAWLINQALKIRLIKQNDLELDFVGNKKLVIANFFIETENTSIRLLKNKSILSEENNMIYLLSELANFDYFIMAHGYDEQFFENTFKSSLQSIWQISFMQRLDINKIKSKHNLLF